jgi:hypothetical protein
MASDGGTLTAYGLALDGDIAVQGAVSAPDETLAGRVAVVGDSLGEAEGERLFTQGDEQITLDRIGRGYRMRVGGLGDFGISGDGTRIACGPSDGAWPWQRVLAGHALPMAALLQGVEVLHAGGVMIAGRGVAIAAGSHGGKSSLSVNLALRGHPLLSDDAIGVVEEGLLVHPGVGAATLRAGEVESLRERGLLERLEVVGEEGGVVRVLLERQPGPVPLGAVYWPERDGAAQAIAFERLPAEPRRVLASTINLVLKEPERMRRHFAVSSAIAAAVPLVRAAFPAGVGAAELAAAIEAHAQELLGACSPARGTRPASRAGAGGCRAAPSARRARWSSPAGRRVRRASAGGGSPARRSGPSARPTAPTPRSSAKASAPC